MIATATQFNSVPVGCGARGFARLLPDILGVLGSRRYLRAPLCTSPRLESAVWSAVRAYEPIDVVLLWGKGPKLRPDRYEYLTAEFLRKYARRVSSVWSPGVRYRVLFADTHAALNGYSGTASEEYFAAVRSMLGSQNTYGTLSSLWDRAGLTWDSVSQRVLGLKEGEWQEVDTALGLSAAAELHCVGGDPQWSARVYYVVRQAEGRILADAFSDCLYATSEGPDRHRLLPGLPVLHMYSWARGRCARPWNVATAHDTLSPVGGELASCAA